MKRNYLFVVMVIFFGVISGNAAAHHERKNTSIVLDYLEDSTGIVKPSWYCSATGLAQRLDGTDLPNFTSVLTRKRQN